MWRTLLLLMLNLSLALSSQAVSSPLVDALTSWGEAAAVDCCPPDAGDAGDTDDDDCCDDDHGMCCVLVAASLPASQLHAEDPPLTTSGGRLTLCEPWLLPRANGPPRLRPPIA